MGKLLQLIIVAPILNYRFFSLHQIGRPVRQINDSTVRQKYKMKILTNFTYSITQKTTIYTRTTPQILHRNCRECFLKLKMFTQYIP